MFQQLNSSKQHQNTTKGTLGDVRKQPKRPEMRITARAVQHIWPWHTTSRPASCTTQGNPEMGSLSRTHAKTPQKSQFRPQLTQNRCANFTNS